MIFSSAARDSILAVSEVRRAFHRKVARTLQLSTALLHARTRAASLSKKVSLIALAGDSTTGERMALSSTGANCGNVGKGGVGVSGRHRDTDTLA